MAYELKEGQGSLFKNDKQNDRQPDFKGSILIGGTTYEIAAWNKTSRNGLSYMSLQASLPRERGGEPQVQRATVETPELANQPYPDYIPSGDSLEDMPF